MLLTAKLLFHSSSIFCFCLLRLALSSILLLCTIRRVMVESSWSEVPAGSRCAHSKLREDSAKKKKENERARCELLNFRCLAFCLYLIRLSFVRFSWGLSIHRNVSILVVNIISGQKIIVKLASTGSPMLDCTLVTKHCLCAFASWD